MKKLLALALVLVMLTALFAACGEKAPVEDPDTTSTGTPAEDTTAPAEETPAEPEETKTTITATIDMTDQYTLVIETVDAAGDDRMGVRAPEGKIQAGTYNAAGNARTASYEFDWAELGLEGYAWEYLGSQVEIDTSGEKPVIVGTPDKSTFCVKLDEIEFVDDGKSAVVGGHKFDILSLNYGMLRKNTLLNEGGRYIPKWNDHTTITCSDSTIFKAEKFVGEYYFFTKADQFEQSLIINLADTAYEGNTLPEGIR